MLVCVLHAHALCLFVVKLYVLFIWFTPMSKVWKRLLFLSFREVQDVGRGGINEERLE